MASQGKNVIKEKRISGMKLETVQLMDIAEISPPISKEVLGNLSQLISFVPMASVSEITGSITKIENRVANDCKKGLTSFKKMIFELRCPRF
ncbi:hypothetical protein [Leptospira santarosai]